MGWLVTESVCPETEHLMASLDGPGKELTESLRINCYTILCVEHIIWCLEGAIYHFAAYRSY